MSNEIEEQIDKFKILSDKYLSEIINNNYNDYNDLKILKIKLINLQKIENSIKKSLDTIHSVKYKISESIQNSLPKYEKSLNELEEYLNISNDEKQETSTIQISPGVNIRMKKYENENQIPILSYGVINKYDKNIIVYRFGKNNFISCDKCEITENDNIRSIHCNNYQNCKFGDKCKYFHDPYYTRSSQIQKFPKNVIIKNLPYFGNNEDLSNHLKTVKFDNVKSFARYVAIMNLYISMLE